MLDSLTTTEYAEPEEVTRCWSSHAVVDGRSTCVWRSPDTESAPDRRDMHVGNGGRFFLSLLMFSVIAATTLAAQGTASAAADSLFRALAQQDWAGAARLVDPAHAASQRKLDLALVLETLAISEREAAARGRSSGALVSIGGEIDTMDVERT